MADADAAWDALGEVWVSVWMVRGNGETNEIGGPVLEAGREMQVVWVCGFGCVGFGLALVSWGFGGGCFFGSVAVVQHFVSM